ncbi:hypothetical protein [Isoptericola croceus]|uniref:hypothetical protein n=1 Tax=Isoptericola croceus TaxID=3031406 RepID=UPI0023F8A566|nr:hypothetical protein [Isoptericola croceus]
MPFADAVDPRLLPAPRVVAAARVAFNHRISPELKARVEDHCERTGESQVDLVTRALDVVLEASEIASGARPPGGEGLPNEAHGK